MPLPDHIVFNWDTRGPSVDLGEGVVVPATFGASLIYVKLGGGVTMDVACEGGRPRVVALHVTESPGHGVNGLSIAQVSIQRVLESAVEAMAGYYALTQGRTPPAGRPVIAVRAAVRKRLTVDRLERVLDAYREGGIDKVKETEGVGERQAYRLLDRAREALGGES